MRRLHPFAFLPFALTACGDGTDDKFAPPCPGAAILRDAADLHRFRGTGRDFTDTLLDGRISGLGGSCKRDGPNTVVATVTVGIDLTRGPAAADRQVEIAYFVAVVEGDTILDKRVFRLRPSFAANSNRLRLDGDELELRLPVSKQKSAAAYRIQVGFQLTPQELAVNRQGGK